MRRVGTDPDRGAGAEAARVDRRRWVVSAAVTLRATLGAELDHAVDVELWCFESQLFIDHVAVTARAQLGARVRSRWRETMAATASQLRVSRLRPHGLRALVAVAVTAAARDRIV